MPAFITRRERMSSHTRRPRSGNIDMHKPMAAEEQRRQHSGTDFEQEARGLPSPATTTTTPVSPRRSPAALIIDSSGAGSGSGGRFSSIRSRTRTEPAAGPGQQQQQQNHDRGGSWVVSRSLPATAKSRDAQHWEGEQQPGRHVDLRWDQQDTSVAAVVLTDATTTSSSSSSSRGGGHAETVKETVPSKRQRQLSWSTRHHETSTSGPIDIPPSPGQVKPRKHASFGGGYDDDDSIFEGGGALALGGKAATHAGAWYPCWPSTKPNDDDACGDGGVPPHILIWEESVMRRNSMQHQEERQQQAALDEQGGARGLLGSRRVSEGLTEDGSVDGQVPDDDGNTEEEEEDEGEDEDDDDDSLEHHRRERRMSSEYVFEMDLDM